MNRSHAPVSSGVGAALVGMMLASAWPHAVRAQDAATTLPSVSPLPAEAMQLLEDVRDNVLSFDEPAFYWLCRYVAADEPAPYAVDSGDEPVPWKFLLERPNDFRGRPVLIEGVVRAVYAYDVENRPGIGRLHQYEIAQSGSQRIAAVVATEPADVERGDAIRARGFFLKVRAYRTNTGESGAGPLLVTRRVHAAPSAGDTTPQTPSTTDPLGWMIAAIAVLALAWLVLRRGLRRPPQPAHRRGEATDASGDPYAWMNELDAAVPADREPPEADPLPERGVRRE